MRVVGIEVAKTSILCCLLNEIPDDPVRFAKTYKPEIFKPDAQNLAKVAELGDLYVLEPTGVYSRIWLDYLKRQGKDVRLVSPKRITHLRRSYGVESKTDRYDAVFIALYGLMHSSDQSQFLGQYAEYLRDLVLTHRTLTKVASQNANRIWRNLAIEWPEACTNKNGGKPAYARKFLEPNPPGIYRFLAGESFQGSSKRANALSGTVGSGLSDLTQMFARHLVEIERAQFAIEEQISALLDCSEFEAYQRVFRLYGFGPMTRAVLLSRIHPIERFLDENNRPIVEYVKTSVGRSKRRVSLSSFKLSLGLGTVVSQSGNAFEEKPGGAAYARSALFLHCKTRIVMRSPSDPEAVRWIEHRRYYEDISSGVPHNRAVMKVCAKICKDLFRDLVSSI